MPNTYTILKKTRLPDILYWNRPEILGITQYLQSILHNMYLGLAITYSLDFILYFVIIAAMHCCIKKGNS
ncbi:hypothetical protein DDW12_09680 [Sulfolobus islandicus]|nr:hypothetical protein DDW12_09680 [Sulfolobus islandicus]